MAIYRLSIHLLDVKLNCMRRKKRPLWILILTLLSFAGLFYLVISYDPAQKYLILNTQYSILLFFFVLLFLLSSSITAYVFNNLRRGILVGLFTTSYFLLRFLHLTQISFLILLIAFFIALEFFFSHKRQ